MEIDNMEHNPTERSISIYGYTKKATVKNSAYVLTATSEFAPLIWHKGILFLKADNFSVLHNSPTLTNNVGGSVVSEPLKEWLLRRKILTIDKVSLNNLRGVVSRTEDKRFNLLSYNCEHFVSDVMGRPAVSNQLRFWCSLIIVYLLVTHKR